MIELAVPVPETVTLVGHTWDVLSLIVAFIIGLVLG